MPKVRILSSSIAYPAKAQEMVKAAVEVMGVLDMGTPVAGDGNLGQDPLRGGRYSALVNVHDLRDIERLRRVLQREWDGTRLIQPRATGDEARHQICIPS